jgi:transcriptional regulator GlxA family with amidase domain
LIGKEFCSWTFFAGARQTVDFPRRAGVRRPHFNKVIHMMAGAAANNCQIKYLAAFPEAQPKLRAA